MDKVTEAEIERWAYEIRKAIENMPYLDFTVDNYETDEERPETLREFYEDTWQGEHAEQLFADVEKTIATAIRALAANPQ